jgi:hypothetical protein
MYINKRRYWDEAQVEERERERMSARANVGRATSREEIPPPA